MPYATPTPVDTTPLLDAVLSHSAVLTNLAAIVVLAVAGGFLLYLFQPLLKGLLRAAWLLLRARLPGARGAGGLKPGVAAELRTLTARG